MMSDILSFADQLKIEGVSSKGFGIIPKFVMLDRDLSLEAKSIYSYFCSFAGNGTTTFPSRSKILSDLKMSKDAYYKHFGQLVKNGYLTVRQEKSETNKFQRNIYTIVSNPKKFQEDPSDSRLNKVYTRIRFSGLKAAGYGIIPKAVMIDPRLTVKAKGIYAYFCSFSGSGNSSFPEKSKILWHLNVSEPTYYRQYSMLTKLGYIMAVQRHDGGRLSVNDYYLCDNPDEEVAASRRHHRAVSQHLKKQDTEKPECCADQYLKKQDTEKQDTQKQYMQKQDAQKADTIKNNSFNQQFLNQQFLNQQSLNQQGGYAAEQPSERPIDREKQISSAIEDVLTNKQIDYYYCANPDLMTGIIHFATNWDVLHQDGYPDPLRQRVYNLFNEALIEMLTCNHNMTLKKSTVTYAKVLERLNAAAKFHVDYIDLSEVMDPSIENYIAGVRKADITNPMPYMMSCIWDALLTGNIRVYQELERDGYGYHIQVGDYLNNKTIPNRFSYY